MSIKTGIIKVIDPKKCTVRVEYMDTGLLSAEMQLTYSGTSKNKEYYMPSIDEQVVVGITDQGVGFIIGYPYSESDLPPVTDENKRHMLFKDGTSIEYDTSTHTLAINCIGPIDIVATGHINVTGDVIADGISLKDHTHTGVHGITSAPNGGG